MVCSVLGSVSLAFGPGLSYLRPSRLWGAGLVALAAGIAVISLGGYAPTYVPHVAGTGLVALALTFAQSSALKICDKNGHDVGGWILLGVIVIALHVLERITVNAWLHHIVGMGTLGLLACRVAYGFDRSSELREGRALRAIAFIVALCGLLMVMRGAYTLVLADPDRPAQPGVTEELMLVGLIAGLLLGTILLLWVMTERIDVRMRRLALLDPLTGALSRQAFIQNFEREAARALRRPDSRFALLLFDIDHFSRINDAWGQRAGDRSLASVVALARPAVGGYHLIGRLEGDVFAILLRGTHGDAAAAVAQRIRQEIERQASVRAALKNPVTVSMGVAVYGAHGRRWEEVLRAAETAVRSAKADGGNRVIAAPPALRPANLADVPLERPVAVPLLRRAV